MNLEFLEQFLTNELENKSNNDILLTKYDFNLENADVRPSTIHGNGIFASNDIKKNTVITLYSADMLETVKNKKAKVWEYEHSYSDEDKDLNIKPEDYDGYIFQVNKLTSVGGNLNNISNRSYIGHILNDISAPSTLQAELEYSKGTGYNCMFQNVLDCHIAIIATRDIKKDEELFISYGVEYWKYINSK